MFKLECSRARLGGATALVALALGCSQDPDQQVLDAAPTDSASAEDDVGSDVVDEADAAETMPVVGRVNGVVRLEGVTDLAGFEVHLVGKGTTKTAVDGTFAFEDVQTGTATVIATVPSTLEGSKTAIVDVSAGTTKVPELVFTAVGEIGGVATFGTATGNAGITILAGADRSATTDDAGNYVLRNVPLGTKDLMALFPEWPSAAAKGVAVEWSKRAVAPDMVLVKAPVASGEIHGTITVTGESAHDGVIVLATGPTGKSYGAVSTATGAWSIGGLTDGEYALTVTAPSTVEGSRTAKVTVDKGKSVAADAMTFTPLGTLKGKATLGGASTANAGIMVWVPDVPAVSTNDAGEWEIRGVRTGVSTISASRSGWGTKSVAGPTLHWRETLTASTIDLTMDPSALSTIAGKALLPGVSTHDGTVVTVSGSGVTATTSADGSYSLKVGGDPTRRTVAFKSKDGRYNGSLDVLLTPGASAVRLDGAKADAIPTVRLVRGTRIGRGVVLTVTPAGEVIALVQESGYWDSTTSFHIDRVTPTGVATTLVADASGALTNVASTDGRWLAYKSASSWFLLDTTSAATVKLGTFEGAPRFSEDQQSISYVDSTLHVRRLTSGTTIGFPMTGDCILSPTAASVACVEYGVLRVAKVVGGAALTTSSYPTSTTTPRPVWTTDERLFHLTGAGGLGVFDLSKPSPTDVEGFSSGLGSLVRSPDGKHVLAGRTTSSSSAEIDLIVAGSVTPVRLGSSIKNAFPAGFSNDSTRVGWADVGGASWAALSAPTSATVASTAPPLTPVRLWFMGNDAMVVEEGGGSTFHHVPTSGSGGVTLPAASSYVFSADNKKLFTASDSGFRTLDASGTVGLVSRSGLVDSTGPFSPDGARVTATIAFTWGQYFSATFAGTEFTPIGYPRRLRWVSTTQAVLDDLNMNTIPPTYPSADDSLWLATFP